MVKDLEFRRLKKDDEEGLSRLFWDVLKNKKDSKYWHWKYYQNPAGEHMMIVALDKDKIIGVTGTIPEKIKVGSRVLLSSQPVDVVILPEYRDRKTFLKMEEIAREECLRNGVKLNYGFSVKITYHISTLLLRFVGICPIFNMTKILNPTPYLRQKIGAQSIADVFGFLGKQSIKTLNKKKVSIPKELKIEEVRQFDHRFDDFWYREAKNYELAVIRDSHYLNWRFLENPTPYKIFCVTQNESIKGFIVLKCSQEEFRRGRILDILVESAQKRIIDLLLTKAINYFLEQEVDVITCWMFEHWPIFQALKKRGFIKRESPHHLIVRSFMDDFSNEYFQDKSKWYVTMSDSDYF